MTKEMAELLNKIFELAQYNQDTKTYYLSKKDYLYLNIPRNTRIKLSKLCQELGINIEYPNKPLPNILCEELFEEYNQIQSKIKTKLTPQEKQQLESRKIELRNQIVVSNLPLVKTIINHRIEDIHTNMSKDDIYQIGYEMLIKYIDRNYLNKELLKHHISCILIVYIEKELLHLEKNANYYHQEQISILKEDSPRKNNISDKRIKELTNLENIISSLSLDEEIEKQEINIDSQLQYEYDYESIFNRYLQQKYINLTLSTLPKDKQILINLYFGLNGNKIHTITEIAKIKGMTKSAISSSIIDTLNIIKKTYRIFFLKEIYQITNIYTDEMNPTLNQSFEEFLIRNLEQETIEYISKFLKTNQQKFIILYCNNQEYSLKEIAKILNISRPYIHTIKKDTIDMIRKTIIELLGKETTYKEYIEYLMNVYKKRNKVLKK